MTSSEITVAYPGREGAHPAAACEQMFPDAQILSVPTFSDVADAVIAGDTDFGVLPIESSLVGPVAETHDILYDSPLSIVGETMLPIRHCIVGPAPIELDAVSEVHSHPVALDQCRKVLASMPNATAVAANTTGTAATDVARLGNAAIVAIASERAARLNDLTVIADNVGDHPEAYTRFVSVACYTRLGRSDGDWRTAFSFVTDHRPGALFHALEPIARHEIDLCLLGVAAHPVRALALPLRRDPERSSARPRDRHDVARDDGSHRAPARIRLLPGGRVAVGAIRPLRPRARAARATAGSAATSLAHDARRDV